MEEGSVRAQTIKEIHQKRLKRRLRTFAFFFSIIVLTIFFSLNYIGDLTRQQTLETNIQAETDWPVFLYEYIGSGSNNSWGGNPNFYLAHNGQGYYLIQVEQDNRTVEQVTLLEDRRTFEVVYDSYDIE
ncbi:hypothetical protein EPH95_16630 [Salicibibacter halophilus]|uniref:Uncharacterized protein n=1 Tax=Salicibibacter halophilus TaxID=2502791 RepID=A0A514LL48_9BACI|nr:hypothetical protein [Salicibibacter halophilus]QDI92604.1 hypothetical protein EPH95_16630 [Salicibibacter halophilus]